MDADSPEKATPAARSVLVVGGGVGGLSAAARLARAGCDVTLIEKNPRVGGKLNRLILPHPDRPGERPFTFDTGPSLLTMPFVFEQFFEQMGTRLDRELDLVRLDPISRFIWPDGQSFDLRSGPLATLEQVAALSPADVEGWRRLYTHGRKIWELAGELFLMNAPEQVLGGRPGAKQGLGMATVPFRIGMFRRFSKLVDRHVKHPRLRQVLYQYATYSGASPWKAPATLGVIPFVEAHFGGWYPRGGMYALAEAMERQAREAGVRLLVGQEVERILIDPPRRPKQKPAVRGVRLAGGEELLADIVVANSDVVSTYRDRIDPAFRPKWPDAKLARLDPGGSGMVLLLGVEGTYPQLAHHTKFMPEDYAAELRTVFDDGRLPDEPCIYVCASTRTDPTQAPDGCENLFVLVSAPPLHGKGATIDWKRQGPAYRDRIVRRLEETFGLEGLTKRIVAESWYTPERLRDDYHANAGSIYGIGSNSRLQAFLRPPNRDSAVKGLFFVGGATHPGGGLPLVTLGGRIVSELVTGRPVVR